MKLFTVQVFELILINLVEYKKSCIDLYYTLVYLIQLFFLGILINCVLTMFIYQPFSCMHKTYFNMLHTKIKISKNVYQAYRNMYLCYI